MFSSMQFLRSGLASVSPSAQQRLVTNLSSTRFRRLDLNPTRFFLSSPSALSEEAERLHPSFAHNNLLASSTTANTLAKRALPFEDTASPFSPNGSPRFKHNREASQSYFYIFFGLLLAVAVGTKEKKVNELQAQEKGFSTDDPLGSQYFSSLEAGALKQEHLSRVKTSYKERLAVLNISGFSLEELKALDQWLTTHYHCFMRLEGTAAAEAETAIQSIERKLKKNEGLYRDRASPAECARFACLAYEKDLDQIVKQLPPGWELLRAEDNRTVLEAGNKKPYFWHKISYYGVAFVNHSTRNVIVAHRGTDSINDLFTDLDEVVLAKLGPHQKSARDFADKVHERVSEYHYTIGCTGHSLGGWLAQLTAFYLQQKNSQKSASVYAVCLDSPGAKDMIDKKYFDKYSGQERPGLDVVNYMMSPNLINTHRLHEGTLYKVPDSAESPKCLLSRIAQHFFSIETHDKVGIAKFFEGALEEPEGLSRIINWPAQGIHEPYMNDTAVAPYDQKTKPHEPDTLRLVHFSRKTKRLLNDISNWRGSLAEVADEQDRLAAWRCFLEQKAKKEISSDEFQLLWGFTLEGDTIRVNGVANALVFRKNIELFLLCHPELVKQLEGTKPTELSKFYSGYYQCIKPPELSEQGCGTCPPFSASDRSKQHQTIDKGFSTSNIVQLFGPAGSGKSGLASSYGKRFAEQQAGKRAVTHFIDASTPNTLQRGWRELAAKLGVKLSSQRGDKTQELKKAIYSALESRGSYLLIFDHLASIKEAEDYLPATEPSGKILIVSDSKRGLSFASRTVFGLDMVKECPLTEAQLGALLGEGAASEFLQFGPELKTLLARSPLTVAILARYFTTQAFEEKQELVAALNLKQPEEADLLDRLSEVMIGQACKKLGCSDDSCSQEKEAITRSILPLLYEVGLPSYLIRKWWNRAAAQAGSNPAANYETIAGPLVEALTGISVLSQEANTQIHAEATRAIRKILSPKKEQHMQLLEFLSGHSHMDNIHNDDLTANENLSSLSRKILENTSSEARNNKNFAYFTTKILNSIANNELRKGRLQESENNFKQVKKICESLAPPTPPAQRAREQDIFEELKKINNALALQYAKSIHYLGKIYFQTNRSSEAESYFNLAVLMIKQLKCTPLRDEFCKEVNIESIIYQRQGPGWILLQSKEKNDLEEAEKLYLKVYEEEDHPFNHYYCNLQLARAYFKLSQVSDEKKKIDHYYKSAIERLNEGGVHEHTPFDSALSIAENKGKTWVDAKPAIYLLQGEILADKNGDRDFQKAEASFQKVIDLGALSPDKPLDDYVFLAHYQLAMLYICQANLCHILPREKKEYIFKAKKSAWDALRKLAKQPGILDKRQNEIDELEELLDKHVDN